MTERKIKGYFNVKEKDWKNALVQELEILRNVAQQALDAYENRFESVVGKFNGPIDEEMKALKQALEE